MDLVEVLKDATSLLVCTRKNFFWLGGAGFFVSDVISIGLLTTLAHFTCPWALTVWW